MFEGRDSFEVATFVVATSAAFVGTTALITAGVANSRCTKLTSRVENVEAVTASHDDVFANVYKVRNSD